MAEAAIKVLNVDDDDTSRYAVSRALKHKGFEVVEAATGKAALTLAREQPDLVLLDVQLPDINGLDVCQQLKSDPATASIPVLQISSTYITSEDQAKGLNHGADAYLTHPVDPSVLVATVKALVRAREAERALAEEMERLTVTLKSIGDAVITTDADGNIELMNRVAESLTGWPLKGARGRPLGEVFRAIDVLSGEPRHALTAGQLSLLCGTHNHVLLIDRNGEKRLISKNISRIADRQRAPAGFVLVFRDITIARRAEEELNKAQRLESLGVLAGGIAHDFNNILTAILGNIALARLPEADSSLLLSEAERACLRARLLTKQLLTFARGGEPVKKPMPLNDLLLEMTEFGLRGAPTSSQFDIAPDLWIVDADWGQLGQALNNLVINAKEAMGDGGTVYVTASNVVLEAPTAAMAAGRYVRIGVRDEGTGIPAKNIDKIFDPYFTTKAKGSGLGLASTYSIVKRHGGHIEVESEPGRGSEFVIYLPASNKTVNETESDEEALAPGSGRVLVMDDEPQILAVAQHLLTALGYTIETARHGGEAIAKYRQAMQDGRPFGLVILDLTVRGGIGGKECLQELKALDPNVVALVTSGYSNDPIMSAPQDFGFAGFIAKPFRLDELASTLATVMKARDADALG